MKQILVVIAMSLAFINSAVANKNVESSLVIKSAELIDFDIQQGWLGSIDEGSVSVNLTQRTITLSLTSHAHCPFNAVCIEIAPEHHKIEVMLEYTLTDRCGSTFYIGKKDKTTVDGLLEKVMVADHSLTTCEMALPFLTEVSYETFNPWTQQTLTSFLGGEQLFLQPNFHN